MERIVCLVRKQFMCLHTHQNIGGLDADHHLMIVKFFNHTHLIQRTLHNSFRSYTAVLLYQIFLKRTAVYADTNRNVSLPCSVHNRLHLIRAADIPGIDANLVRAVFHGSDGHFVVKMNVRDQRNMDLFLDLGKRLRSLRGWNRTANDLTPRLLKRKDLLYRCLDILCLRICHRLNQNRIPSSDFSVSDLNHSCMISVHYSTSFPAASPRIPCIFRKIMYFLHRFHQGEAEPSTLYHSRLSQLKKGGSSKFHPFLQKCPGLTWTAIPSMQSCNNIAISFLSP